MSHHFIVCETSEKKFIKRVYDNYEECHQYFTHILKEIHLKPESYRVVNQSNSELIVEEIGESMDEGSRRTYTIVEGEIADVLNSIMGHKDEDMKDIL